MCTEWKAEDLASLGNVIEPPMTPNNIDLHMNGPDYITPLIKEKIDSVLGVRNPVSPILWSVGLRPIQDSNSKDGFEIDDDQTLPIDFVAPSFGDYGSPSSEPWHLFQESNYELDQTNIVIITQLNEIQFLSNCKHFFYIRMKKDLRHRT